MDFVFVQWARLHPRGWERASIDELISGARVAAPAPGRGRTSEGLTDEALYMNRVFCMGVNAAADHYAFSRLPRRGLRWTAWWADPEDYDPDMFFAIVRDVWLPRRVLSHEPGVDMFGSRWNAIDGETQKKPVVYAAPKAMELFKAEEPIWREHRPWSEFVPPSNPHHGIWLPDDLHVEHERAIGVSPTQTSEERIALQPSWTDFIVP